MVICIDISQYELIVSWLWTSVQLYQTESKSSRLISHASRLDPVELNMSWAVSRLTNIDSIDSSQPTCDHCFEIQVCLYTTWWTNMGYIIVVSARSAPAEQPWEPSRCEPADLSLEPSQSRLTLLGAESSVSEPSRGSAPFRLDSPARGSTGRGHPTRPLTPTT